MNKIVPLTLAACVMSVSAFAKDLQLPDEKPVVTFKLPDSWSPKEMETGYEATSDDGSTYLSLELLDAKTMDDVNKLIDDATKYLTSQGVVFDRSTMKTEDTVVNGMKGFKLSANGKDKDGDTIVNMFLLYAGKDKEVVFTYWGTPEGQAKNVPAVNDALQSIKPTS